MKKVKTTKLLLEVDTDTYEKIKQYAKFDRRTIKATFEIMIEKAVKELKHIERF